MRRPSSLTATDIGQQFSFRGEVIVLLGYEVTRHRLIPEQLSVKLLFDDCWGTPGWCYVADDDDADALTPT